MKSENRILACAWPSHVTVLVDFNASCFAARSKQQYILLMQSNKCMSKSRLLHTFTSE